MTDDIVARLRSPEVFIDTGGMFSPVAHEAADEIERLRAVLREIEDCDLDPRLSRQSCVEQLQSMARAALEGEKKDEN